MGLGGVRWGQPTIVLGPKALRICRGRKGVRELYGDLKPWKNYGVKLRREERGVFPVFVWVLGVLERVAEHVGDQTKA